jgi:hypothetical protein
VNNTTGCSDSESITITQPTWVSIIAMPTTVFFVAMIIRKLQLQQTEPNYGYAAVPNGAAVPTTFGTHQI